MNQAILKSDDMGKLLAEIKETQEQNKKLLESANNVRKEATHLRDMADATLRNAQQEKIQANEALSTARTTTERSTREMAGRTAAIDSKRADFERKAQMQAADYKQRNDDLTRRTVELEKRETRCREREEKIELVMDEYNAIEEMITRLSGMFR